MNRPFLTSHATRGKNRWILESEYQVVSFVTVYRLTSLPSKPRIQGSLEVFSELVEAETKLLGGCSGERFCFILGRQVF